MPDGLVPVWQGDEGAGLVGIDRGERVDVLNSDRLQCRRVGGPDHLRAQLVG